MVFTIGVGGAFAQTMSTPTQQQGCFCSHCKIQNCSCNVAGDECVACGLTTGATGGQSTRAPRAIAVTRQVCREAGGRMVGNTCRTD